MPKDKIEIRTKPFKPKLIKKTKSPRNLEPKLPTRRPILRIIITKATITAAAFVAIPAHAKSEIDPLTQVYIVREIDTLSGLPLKRTYSSGSAFRGHFGPGWCSELDGRVLTYDGGELRYRGCDVDSALLSDVRESASIRRTASGFARLREDGATQRFSHSGTLEKVERADGSIQILRGENGVPAELVIQTIAGSERFKVEIATQAGDASSALIQAIGSKSRFGYSGSMLTSWSEGGRTIGRYAYDEALNMTEYRSISDQENVQYDAVMDRAVRFERSAAFERERLLLTMKVNEKFGTIEMKAEVERGAEMHPVFILYSPKTQRLSLEGSREVARLFLSWLRT